MYGFSVTEHTMATHIERKPLLDEAKMGHIYNFQWFVDRLAASTQRADIYHNTVWQRHDAAPSINESQVTYLNQSAFKVIYMRAVAAHMNTFAAKQCCLAIYHEFRTPCGHASSNDMILIGAQLINQTNLGRTCENVCNKFTENEILLVKSALFPLAANILMPAAEFGIEWHLGILKFVLDANNQRKLTRPSRFYVAKWAADYSGTHDDNTSYLVALIKACYLYNDRKTFGERDFTNHFKFKEPGCADINSIYIWEGVTPSVAAVCEVEVGPRPKVRKTVHQTQSVSNSANGQTNLETQDHETFDVVVVKETTWQERNEELLKQAILID